jgi:hypothetical protein
VKTLVFLSLLLLSGFALANPKVISDPTTATTVTHCAWYLDSTPRQVVPAPKDSTGKPYCEINVSTVTNGAHTIQAAFVIQDSIWGEQEGPKSAPLAFVRPSAPTSAPSAIRLIP